MESIPKISVVMPCWNRASIIQNAIRSIIDQTVTNWEFIIVDDGSTDGTKRVVESFADPRVMYKKIEHSGIPKSRNIGNSMARADIIMVQDSDDVSLPDRIEEILKAFEENPEADLVYHGVYHRYYDPYHDAISRAVKPAMPFDKERLLREQYIPGHVAYKKIRIMEVPYDEGMSSMDDYQMLLEFALHGFKIVPLFKNLYEYVQQDDSNNIITEMDGRRKKDTEFLLGILKDKYGLEMHATLTRTAKTGESHFENI